MQPSPEGLKPSPNFVFQEHIDRAQRNNDYEERWSNSEDETEIDPREVTIGTSFLYFRVQQYPMKTLICHLKYTFC